MSERGKHRYTYISATSNTVVTTSPGTLYGIHGSFIAGTIVRIDDTDTFAQGVLNINAVSSNTIGAFGSERSAMAIGFNEGLAVAVGSNSKITIEWE